MPAAVIEPSAWMLPEWVDITQCMFNFYYSILYREFVSKEECQSFVASLTNAVAEARAEQAAASLLSELEIDSSASSKKGKHRKGKKKGAEVA